MRMLMLGAASIALAASGALADPGKGHGGGGGGHGNGGGHAAAPAPGGPGNGGGKGHGGGPAKGPGGGAGHAERMAQGNPHADRGSGPKAGGPSMPAEHKVKQRSAARVDRGNGQAHGKAVIHDDRGPAIRDARVAKAGRDGDFRNDPRVVRTVAHFDRGGSYGLINGCPPGLAKKNNGCTPPGLARQGDGYRDAYYNPSWFGYPSLGDGRYYYDNGYLYRTNNSGSVLGYLPLLGGALSVGNPWPSYYQPTPVPDYYVQYYNLGAPDTYRYADDVLYRVDPQSDVISSIAALLTGDRFDIGQRMPAGYDVYNVPYAYRDQYYDTPEYDYRYADGYVYQVDPTTQLIQAAIQLLT